MKLIGLLGGTSWPSTFGYYEILNRAANERFGGYHSARILLSSIDYHPIKSLYPNGWDAIQNLLAQEILFLVDRKPDCLIVGNNTLHKALDPLLERLNLPVPVFHAGRLAAEEAVRAGYASVLLVGTPFTMEDGFFAKYFEDQGVTVVIPTPEDRARIKTWHTQLAKGIVSPACVEDLSVILTRYPQVDAVVLGCTELPLAIREDTSPKPLINPVLCQCAAAARFAFDEATS